MSSAIEVLKDLKSELMALMGYSMKEEDVKEWVGGINEALLALEQKEKLKELKYCLGVCMRLLIHVW
jgi:hypothetical protein